LRNEAILRPSEATRKALFAERNGGGAGFTERSQFRAAVHFYGTNFGSKIWPPQADWGINNERIAWLKSRVLMAYRSPPHLKL
jgi:hypothetical protein